MNGDRQIAELDFGIRRMAPEAVAGRWLARLHELREGSTNGGSGEGAPIGAAASGGAERAQ